MPSQKTRSYQVIWVLEEGDRNTERTSNEDNKTTGMCESISCFANVPLLY